MIPSLEALHAAFMRLLTPATSSAPENAAHRPDAFPGQAHSGPETGAPVSAPQSSPEPSVSAGTPPTNNAAALLAPVAAPCQIVDPQRRGFHLDATVAPDRVVAAAELLDQAGFAIDTVTGVDWLAAGELEVVYDFFHAAVPLHVVVRTRVQRTNPELPTISGVFPGANWHERETHDFFGIRFLGHPDLSPLLLPEDATYHPLRKDFVGAA
jgi:NADH:ubiquinone oxidoreductase subunit C